MKNRWKLPSGTSILLLKPNELKELPDGAEVISINGEKLIKGKDYIDDDTRFGYLAYGLLEVSL